MLTHRPGTVALACRDLGGGGLPPVVLLHGFMGSSRNWQLTGRDLATNARIHALDLRNHGDSPSAENMSWDVLVGDVVQWCAVHGVTRARFLGHSLGGKVLMRLACTAPELVESLIVVDIAPKSYAFQSHRHELAALLGLELTGLSSRAEAEVRLEGRIPDLAMRKFLLTNLVRTGDGTWRWAVPLAWLAAALPSLEMSPLDPEMIFAGRATFILGGRSRYVTPDDIPIIRRHFPAAIIETIAASGHNPHMDARADFVACVTAAWRRCGSAT
jgi:pimeloyl-ACP methyl ester carboxylesterase